MAEKKESGPHQERRPFPTGSTVPFPYPQPYPQQIALMDALLSSLKLLRDRRQPKEDSNPAEPYGSHGPSSCPIYMLESPTGTGKSLSLACASLAWLRYTEREDLDPASLTASSHDGIENINGNTNMASGVDWLDAWVPPDQRERDDTEKKAKTLARQSREQLARHLSGIQGKIQGDPAAESAPDDAALLRARRRIKRQNMLRQAVTAAHLADRQRSYKRKRPVLAPSSRQEEDFCVPDYRSEEEDDSDHDLPPFTHEEQPGSRPGTSASTLLDGSRLDGSAAVERNQPPWAVGGVRPGTGTRKIVYAARTHSQLSQFVSELKKTAWGGDNLRVVALGGRKSLCGNHQVRFGHHGLPRSEAAINEACLDHQKARKSNGSSGCPLLASREAVSTLALHLLAQPTDIEEAASLGEASKTCAYYASRASVAAAEVVVLPYSMLLSISTREAIGLSLSEALVIVDEAHNLPEAIRSLHSCQLALPVVHQANQELTSYIDRYAHRLAGRNLYYVGQIRKILTAFDSYLTKGGGEKQHILQPPGELLVDLKLDNINMFKILRYLDRSRLPQKLLGFKVASASHDTNTEGQDLLSKHTSALSHVKTFLQAICTSDQEGKIAWSKTTFESVCQVSYPSLRYVLLKPAKFFENVLSEAHALALVGGTLRPFTHVAAELLGSGHPVLQHAARADQEMEYMSKEAHAHIASAFTGFSCDHIVPSRNVMLLTVSSGPTGQILDFRHQTRNDFLICDELGKCLLIACQSVPGGVVVFLPSYSYERYLTRRWKDTGMWSEIDSVKRIHREPRNSQNVESVLRLYTADVQKGGAMLIAIVGGKMSEGLNFADEMARCVMVVGLPFGDPTDPELKEKMEFLDKSTNNSISGESYYHNLCMRAVNQSIGRAIRHAGDYAVIMLMDQRYVKDRRIFGSLPRWLRKESGPTSTTTFPVIAHSLTTFFSQR